MPRYLIELPHDNEPQTCARALESIERYGAHLLTHLDWGCQAGVHSGWLIVEVESRDDAVRIVPPLFRRQARIVPVHKLTREKIASLSQGLQEEAPGSGNRPATAPGRVEGSVQDEWSIPGAACVFFQSL